MADSLQPLALPSFASTVDSDPYGYYDRLREQGDAVWDEQLHAWLVVSYPAIRTVMRQDKTLVRHPSADTPNPALHTIQGGRRSRLLLHGAEHGRHHRFFVRRFTYTLADQWRETLLRPILDRLLDPVVPRGHVEFWADLSDRFSVRVISAIMGLPWEDDALVDHCKSLLDRKQRFIDLFTGGVSDEITQDALAAVEEMNALLLPFIEAAREREPREDDIMALLWAEGPSIMPDWGIEDMQAWIATTYFAGTDTTTHAMSNALYLLMTVDGLQDELRAGGETAVEHFSEEVLRLYPSTQFIRRFANEDFDIGGAAIKKDDLLFMLNAGANHDPQRFGCPNEIDLDRDQFREHLGFSVGPRTCGGAALARAEIQETVSKVLERLPNLRLDPDAEPPSFRGFLLRSYRPLNALFDPS
jgi:cytochrome P450